MAALHTAATLRQEVNQHIKDNKSEEMLNKELDKLYKEYGASDDVIQLQVAINNLRNSFDVPDKAEMTTSNKGFVQ